MLAFIQAITVVAMIAATFLVYKSLGPRRDSFVYTREQKKAWDALVAQTVGSWFTAANITATLTSLATVYIFFIGNTKLFGFVICITVVTIWGGAFVTKRFTEILISRTPYRDVLDSGEPTAGVIASVFWRKDDSSRHNAMIIRYVTMVNIGCILWLEFSVFGDISGQLVAGGNLAVTCLLLFVTTATIAYFTFEYGLRGFVFADLFQSPLIVIGSLGLLAGVIVVALRQEASLLSELIRLDTYLPVLSWWECILFVLATLFLNSFLVVTSQSHWLRVWMFGQKVISLQIRSLSVTACIWLVLIAIGVFAGLVTEGRFGKDAVAQLIVLVSEESLLFVVAFWVAGSAVLFSTADTQFYAFLLTRHFDVSTGKLVEAQLSAMKPLRLALFVALIFTVVYFFVQILEIPFEKLVFLLLPISMICVPTFVSAVRGQRPAPWLLWLSLGLYGMCAILALVQPADQFLFSIAAPLMPAIVSILTFLPWPRSHDFVS